MKNNDKNLKLNVSFRQYLVASVSFLVLLILGTAVLVPLFAALNNNLFIYLFVGYVFLLFVIYFFVLRFINKRMYSLFYENIYRISVQNYDKILNNRADLALYTADKYEEIDELNVKVNHLSESLAHTVILPNEPDYGAINLEYIDKEKHIITNESLHQYLDQIIYCSQSFRNVLIQFYYEFEAGQEMSDEELEKLYNLILSSFQDYQRKLLAPTKAKDGIYLYLPQTDAIHNITEKMDFLLNQATLLRENLNGALSNLPVHVAMVCFPYSNINEMFADIQFAKRMGKLINIYFPQRTTNLMDISNLVQRQAMNLNYVSKLLSLFTSLDISKKSDNILKTIRSSFQFFLAYMKIDQGGLLLLDDSDKSFKVIFQEGDNSTGFVEGQPVESGFIQSLESILDDDHTYYAKSRSNLSVKIAEAADRNGISASFFYAFYGDEGKLRGIVYYNNLNGNLILDAYLRESLLLISTKVGDYFIAKTRQGKLVEEQRLNASLLKLSDYCTYKVNPNTYELLDYSEGINDVLHGNLNKGQPCYKEIYGLSSPCDRCPLRTSRKMKSLLGNYTVETSLTLNESNKENSQKILLAKRIMDKDEDMMDEPYDVNLLVNSYYMLTQSMKNAYLLSSRGYLLLLKIDNQMELVSKYGSEVMNQALRALSKSIMDFETINNVYFYKPDTLAILLSGYGQIDAINECESIYELTQTSFFKDPQDLLKITYLPINYPQGYPSYSDFLRHCEDYYFSKKYETGKDFIYFDENNYSRPASSSKFMLSVIDDKFKNKDFTVNLQPLVDAQNRKIFGAELLLRLSDEYRKITFNTDKLIQTAAKNGKISLISTSLLDYVSSLYAQFGNSVFRVYGFKRLTINTDSSYLRDSTLSDQVKSLYQNNHLPTGFLGFEITEQEIYDHFADMKKFITNLSNLGVKFICDRYNGEYLSFDRLKELGIDEIKIDRDYTRFIDTDKAKYTMVKSLLEESKTANIRVGLIGVENMEQYNIIKEINPDCYVQGYAFFKPLDKQTLVDVIRRTNSIIHVKS
jgi:EAL domain-containing protein (putative c-di-GMP-specific phosphodiesterase class I)